MLPLILATFILFTLVPRYEVDSTNLLYNSAISKGFKTLTKSSSFGKKTQNSCEALLENRDAPCTVFLRQHLPISRNTTQLVLTAELNTHNVF